MIRLGDSGAQKLRTMQIIASRDLSHGNAAHERW